MKGALALLLYFYKGLIMINDNIKDFLKTFHILTYANSKWDVWQDFIYMSSCSFSNAVAKNDYVNRENAYLRTINKYSERDRKLFPKLLTKLTMALEHNPEQDFLGKIFMELELGSRNKGQFFTPYDVCKLMSEINLLGLEDDVNRFGYHSINDPTCGAGATLIASANVARSILGKKGKNFQNYILFTGQDIDETVGLMCYLQLSLLGCAGYVKIANTFTDPMRKNDDINKYWFTPMYFSDIWKIRRMVEKANSIFKKDEE